jgi:30S ribosomal protein S31
LDKSVLPGQEKLRYLRCRSFRNFGADENKRSIHLFKEINMGRGDKKTKKGKIFKGSFGKSRPAKPAKKSAPAAPAADAAKK